MMTRIPSTTARRLLITYLCLGIAVGLTPLLIALFRYLEVFNGPLVTTFPWHSIHTAGKPLLATGWYVGAALLVHLVFSLSLWLIYHPIGSRLTKDHFIYYARGIVFYLLAFWWILLLHGRFFPQSIFSATLPLAGAPGTIGWGLAILSLILGGVILASLFVSARALLSRGSYRYVLGGLAAIGIASILAFRSAEPVYAPANTTVTQPNVVIIGIDSLRPDILSTGYTEATAEALTYFLDESVVFEQTTTPLARTFPSWVSVLTGLEPIHHGARFNLVPPEQFEPEQSIAHAFRAAGYKTIYATDETRFSNIDTSFGFDEVDSPPIGAADFLLGTLNDWPLINLLVNTRLGDILFPYSHGNRAAHITYRPELFDARLDTLLQGETTQPVFLAVHFCLPHYPYVWAESQRHDKAAAEASALSRKRSDYLAAVHRVDRQFNGLMNLLAERHYLDNAIVVLISDHGESFIFDQDTLTPASSGGPPPPSITLPGHGTHVLNAAQYRVLLALRGYGKQKLPARRIDTPVSLVDVAPTLLDFADGVTAAHEFDGISLKPYLVDGVTSLSADRHIFFESGISLPSILAYHPKLANVLHEGVSFYDIHPSGRLTLRPDSVRDLLLRKQRAVRLQNWTLALLPAPEEKWSLVLVDMARRKTWRDAEIETSPGPWRNMLDALCGRYARDPGVSGNGYCA